MRLFVFRARKLKQVEAIYALRGFAKGEIVPGSSDIDLMVVLEDSDSEALCLATQRISRIQQRLSRYFPMLSSPSIIQKHGFDYWKNNGGFRSREVPHYLNLYQKNSSEDFLVEEDRETTALNTYLEFSKEILETFSYICRRTRNKLRRPDVTLITLISLQKRYLDSIKFSKALLHESTNREELFTSRYSVLNQALSSQATEPHIYSLASNVKQLTALSKVKEKKACMAACLYHALLLLDRCTQTNTQLSKTLSLLNSATSSSPLLLAEYEEAVLISGDCSLADFYESLNQFTNEALFPSNKPLILTPSVRLLFTLTGSTALQQLKNLEKADRQVLDIALKEEISELWYVFSYATPDECLYFFKSITETACMLWLMMRHDLVFSDRNEMLRVYLEKSGEEWPLELSKLSSALDPQSSLETFNTYLPKITSLICDLEQIAVNLGDITLEKKVAN